MYAQATRGCGEDSLVANERGGLGTKHRSWRESLIVGASTIALMAGGPEAVRAEEFEVFLDGGGVFADGDSTVFAEEHLSPTTSRQFEAEPEDGVRGRIGARVRVTPSWDFSLVYSGLKATGDNDATDNSPGYPGTYAADLHNVISTYGGTYYADAEVEIDTTYNVIDLEAGYSMGLGSGASGRLFGGLRLADIHQETRTLFLQGPGTTSDLSEKRESGFSDLGPRLGAAGAVPLGTMNLSVTGSVAGAVLFGDLNTKTVFTVPATGAVGSSEDNGVRTAVTH